MSKSSSGEDLEQEGGGGEPSITPPPNSNSGSDCGEDTAYLHAGLEWGNQGEALFRELEHHKSRAQLRNGLSAFECDGVTFGVRPNGFRLGGKGVYMPLVLEHQGISIGIAPLIKPRPGDPNAAIQISSLPLMEWGGLENTYRIVQNLASRLGCRFIWNKLSRLDFCNDRTDVRVEDFKALINTGHLVTRARKHVVHSDLERMEGIYYGKGGLRLVIYDKLFETQYDPRKRAVLVAQRWGGVPEFATRIEVRTYRAFLGQRGIDSVEHYFEHRSSIVNYFVSRWWRLSSEPVDRANTSRASNHPIWEAVSRSLRDWAGSTSKIPAIRSSGMCDASMLVKQIIGCTGTLAVIENDGRVLTDAELINYVLGRMRRMLEKTDIQEMLKAKRLKWYGAGPSENSYDWRESLRGPDHDAA